MAYVPPNGGWMGGQLNPDGSPRRMPLDAVGQNPRLLDYNTWNSQQANPYNDPMEGSGYRDYTNNFYSQNLGNPSALPQGFLQSQYGQSYLSQLQNYQNPQNANPQDEAGQLSRAQTLQWLQNAPQAYSAGRSLGQFTAPVGDPMYEAMSVAVPALGGAASGGLFNIGMAGVNASTQNTPTAPTQALPSQGQVNQFSNSGGSVPNYFPGGNANFNEGGGLFDNLLGNIGNLSPAILAGYLGNQQRQDVMGQVGRLNTLGDSLSGPAFMNSITNPYDLQTGQGRTALTQNLQQRGVGGSSFGNQQLGNYDYMRGLGRGDLATRAQAGIAGTQGQLYSDALRGIVGGNAAYNQLLGAGLGASGSLFNRPGQTGSSGNGLFDWLRNYLGGTPGSPTENPYPSTDPGGQGGMDPGNDPSLGLGDATQFDPNIDWGNLYG